MLYWVTAILLLTEAILSVLYYIHYFQISNILLLPPTIASFRYVQDIREPAAIASMHIFRFIPPAIHGFICSDPARWRYLRAGYIWLLPITLISIVFSSRSQFLLALAFWVAGYITGAGYFGTASKLGMQKVLALSLTFLVIVVPFSFLVYLIRWGIAAPEQVVWQRAAMAVFGAPIVLGEWLDGGGLDTLSHDFRLFTFNALSRTLGIRTDLTPGIYSESASLLLAGEEAESNIFTAFRPLLDDLGIPGTLVCVLVGAFIVNQGWCFIKRGYIIGVPTVFAYALWVLWSPITSAFSYNAVIAAYVIVTLGIWWTMRADLGLIGSGGALPEGSGFE